MPWTKLVSGQENGGADLLSPLPALLVRILCCREEAVSRVSPSTGSLPLGLAGLKGQQSFSLQNSYESAQKISVLQKFVTVLY